MPGFLRTINISIFKASTVKSILLSQIQLLLSSTNPCYYYKVRVTYSSNRPFLLHYHTKFYLQTFLYTLSIKAITFGSSSTFTFILNEPKFSDVHFVIFNSSELLSTHFPHSTSAYSHVCQVSVST